MRCVCQPRGTWVLGYTNMHGVCAGCLWCGAAGSGSTQVQCGVRPKQPRYWKLKPLPGSCGGEGFRVGGGFQDCQGQLQINQAGDKCLCCFSPPLTPLPALPKINNCVNSRVIVLGQQTPGLPGLGRCWQGLPEPHAGSRLGLAARAAG